jgi:hypothetical protein
MATMNQQGSAPKDHSAEQRENAISYRARRHKRLRLCIKSNTGEQTFSRVTGLADPATPESISIDIGRAQTEMFDDEVFEAVSKTCRLQFCRP